MTTAAKSIRLGSINTRGMLIVILLVLLVIALFFIPEIVDLQKSLVGRTPSVTESRVQIPAVKAPPEQQVKREGKPQSLAQIENLLQSSYLEELKAKKLLEMNKGSGISEEGVLAPPGVQDRPPLSWDMVKGKASANALRIAEKEALEITKFLALEQMGTRYAIYNFVSGISLLLDGGEHSMNPTEAVRYIEYLHYAVLKTMAREGVDRAFYNRWVELSLGPVVDVHRTVNVRGERARFNPKLTLTGVRVFKPGTRHRQWVEHSPAYLRFRGFVMGRDVQKIEVFLNGLPIKSIVPQKTSVSGRRFFRGGQWNAKGIYAFRVFDAAGQIYQKVYSFYPKVRRFPWKSGLFEIPFYGDKDTRLDRFFTLRAGKQVNLLTPDTFFDGVEYTSF